MQDLYEDLGDEGFVILGFPADDVANQEPREDEAIAQFCRANFGVTFPMFSKINVVGDEAAPLFKELGPPDWNFNKYLLGQGRPADRAVGRAHRARRPGAGRGDPRRALTGESRERRP